MLPPPALPCSSRCLGGPERGWIGGEVSNLDLGLQRTPCCRYTTPDRSPRPYPSAGSAVAQNVTAAAQTATVPPRHGLPDQEAPQADAQEEAQEAPQAHALAAPSTGPLSLKPPGARLSARSWCRRRGRAAAGARGPRGPAAS